ncbi:hypothetical protein CK934_16325 [Chitinophaga sp. MD30]|nr:hypothetical protein CK934_16325 [Chitinophaga sp. MD30]
MVTIWLLLASFTGMAQQKIGEAQVNNRIVHLYSDYTWKYADNVSSGGTKPQKAVRVNIAPVAASSSYASSSASSSVGYCGALTKKGTPCRRKVRGGGRCWQH